METHHHTGLLMLTRFELDAIESKPISFERMFKGDEEEAPKKKHEVILVSPSSIASVEAQGQHSRPFCVVTMKERHNGENNFYKVNESIEQINALIQEVYQNESVMKQVQ